MKGCAASLLTALRRMLPNLCVRVAIAVDVSAALSK